MMATMIAEPYVLNRLPQEIRVKLSAGSESVLLAPPPYRLP